MSEFSSNRQFTELGLPKHRRVAKAQIDNRNSRANINIFIINEIRCNPKEFHLNSLAKKHRLPERITYLPCPKKYLMIIYQ